MSKKVKKDYCYRMNCSRCGNKFECGRDSQSECWCVSLPPLKPIPKQYEDCLCPDCLKSFVETSDNKKPSDLIEGEDFYLEKGLTVFTEAYHLKKGHCCDNDCRHCPY